MSKMATMMMHYHPEYHIPNISQTRPQCENLFVPQNVFLSKAANNNYGAELFPSAPFSPDGSSSQSPWGPDSEDYNEAENGSREQSPAPWREESKAAASFWSEKLTGLSRDRVARFQHALIRRVEQRCSGAWYPENPTRGQGLRAIVNSKTERRCDPLLLDAAQDAGIEQVANLLPACVLWVDPGRVACKPDSYDGAVSTQRIY